MCRQIATCPLQGVYMYHTPHIRYYSTMTSASTSEVEGEADDPCVPLPVAKHLLELTDGRLLCR